MLAVPAAESLPGRLAENVMHFGRVLRAAGVPVGTDRIQLALQALQVGGLTSRGDFHAALQSCLIDRAEHRALFDQAFHVFWRDPDLLGRVMRMLLPQVQAKHDAPPVRENRRLAAALFPGAQEPRRDDAAPPPEQIEIDAPLTQSDRERLHHADFETMSADEWRQAKRLLRDLRPWFEPIATRRFRRASHPGRADWRATLLAQARSGDAWTMRWRRVRSRPAPLVILADISGSMSRYSRMLLHFAHALTAGAGGADLRVSTFVFATRLTAITRLLRQRDPDVAVARVTAEVEDWSGGTRITECLHRFNRDWSRRVLSNRGTVLLISDGLERDDASRLAVEAERLHKSCGRCLWLNPLLRYEGFEPRAGGIRVLIEHVDALLPGHNLASLESLARLLARPIERREERR